MDPPVIRVDEDVNAHNAENEVQVAPINDFLAVSNEDANTHTYVYEPERGLHQMTLEAFPSEDNYKPSLDRVFSSRPTLEELMDGQKAQTDQVLN